MMLSFWTDSKSGKEKFLVNLNYGPNGTHKYGIKEMVSYVDQIGGFSPGCSSIFHESS